MRKFAALALLSLTLPAAAQNDIPFGRLILNRYIVTYRSGAVPAQSTPGTRILARHEHLGIAVLEAAAPAALAAMQKDPAIQFVAQDRLVSAHAVTTRSAPQPDSIYHSQQGWAVRAVGGYGSFGRAPDAAPATLIGPWTITRGRGIRIAILDSGVDPAHPDIAPQPRPQPL